MINNTRGLIRISKNLTDLVQSELDRIGIFFRIFSRVKNPESIDLKILKKDYDGKHRFLQDVIGLRIILYFPDDIEHVYDRLKKKFHPINETVDKRDETKFEPTRINLVFKIPADYDKEFRDHIPNTAIDNTFEIQLRTILSEGWHEVEHDMRYKCHEHWESHKDMSRWLNGILAAIETSEWGILNVLNQISYRHYKASNIEALIITKFRLRLTSNIITPGLRLLVDKEFIRHLIKVDRMDVINYIYERNILIPLTIDNLIYIVNQIGIKNEEINNLMPEVIAREVMSNS